jgi:hypothetical protein
MAMNEQAPKTLGDKLLAVPKSVLYLCLVLATAIPLFFPFTVPNRPGRATMDWYKTLYAMPEGATVMLQSDWTNGTRGESRGQFDEFMRVAMRRKLKVGLCSVGDPQAPEVAKFTIEKLVAEHEREFGVKYERWKDWVYVGYFPGAEGTGQAFAADFYNTIKGKRDKSPDGTERPIVESPVMQNIKKLSDLAAYNIITGTKSSRIMIERLGRKVTMLASVTGVMGPETENYYVTGQLSGLVIGLKGSYEVETMLETGVQVRDKTGTMIDIPPYTGKTNLGYAKLYVGPLHAAIGLMILAVVIGNVGVVLNRKKEASS